jgi:hypothetical protein
MERGIDKIDVWAPSAIDAVPRLPARIWGKNEESLLIGESSKGLNCIVRVRAGAVQGKDKRARRRAEGKLGYEHHRVV